jgi:hypothetical protein
MVCDERYRLIARYFQAVDKFNAISATIPEKQSDAWKDTTQRALAACEEALTALHQHRIEHHC